VPGRKIGRDLSFAGTDYLYMFLTSKKTVKVKVNVHFRGAEPLKKSRPGTQHDGSRNEVDAFSMHGFDLRKFDLPKGTIKDKKTFLNATLTTIQNDRKMIEHCRDVCRKF
jgi:hypothetical protein